MAMDQGLAMSLWSQLLWPLLRILFLVSLGLVAANFIEALNWTHRLAILSRPLIRLGRLSSITGTSFSMAFLSGVSANTMLAEAFDQNRLSRKELVLANLLNSLPRFFLHLPTVFFMTAPLIKGAALIYIGLTFSSAMLQTFLVVLGARVLLPFRTDEKGAAAGVDPKRIGWRQALEKSVERFRGRIKKVLFFMVPVYVLFFLLNRYGLFTLLEDFVAGRASFLSWLNPKSLGIVILHVTAEFSAGLAAAGALLAADSLTYKDVVLALLTGNILAAPIRAMRHQFPYYIGIFPPRIALELVGVSQAFSISCTAAIGVMYYLFTVN